MTKIIGCESEHGIALERHYQSENSVICWHGNSLVFPTPKPISQNKKIKETENRAKYTKTLLHKKW